MNATLHKYCSNIKVLAASCHVLEEETPMGITKKNFTVKEPLPLSPDQKLLESI